MNEINNPSRLKKLKINFPKFSMKSAEEVDLSDIDLEKLAQKPVKKRKENYPATSYKTVKEFFYRSAKEYTSKTAIAEKPDHKTPYKDITYGEFYEDVQAFGTAITKVLNKSNARILIVGETQYGWYLSYMTALCGAGIAVPVDRELPDNELESVINRSRADIVIYSTRKEDSIKNVRKNVPTVEYFVEMNSDKPLDGKDVGLKTLVELGRNVVESGDDSFSKIEIDPDEFKVLIFTSGTTSNSKGVMISNRALAENINAVTAYVTLYPTDRLFSVLPLHHTYESTIGFLLPMALGASVAVCEGLRYILPNIQESKPTALLAVPLLIETLYKKINEGIKKSHKATLVSSMIATTNLLKKAGLDIKKRVFKDIYDQLGGRLRLIVSAAAPIDKKAGKWLEDIGIIFLQGYGLTETCPISAVTPDFDPRVGPAGKLIWQAKAKVINKNEDGEGEICVKTPTVMLGYYENEEETKKVIDEEGYFHTGDIGYIDDEGFIFITGRSKNVIVTQNGKNIYPEEIELLLDKVPEIKESMVYGKEPEGEMAKRKDAKELIITARVIPNTDEIEKLHGTGLTDEAIKEIIWNRIKEVNKKLTGYKAIKELEIKEGEFEKTSTMKIKRFKEISKKPNEKAENTDKKNA